MPFTPRRLFLLAASAALVLPFQLTAQRGGAAGNRTAPVSVAISPDGSTLAWVAATREGAQLHITDRAHPDPATDKIVTPTGATSCSNASPVWAPDSQTLAYTSTCTAKTDAPGQPQIFLWSRTSGESRQLTHLTGIFQQAAFSPDGKVLAFLFVENATRNAGALAAMKPWAGVIGEDGVEIQRVYATSIADGQSLFLTPPDLHVYEFTWNPTSPEIAFIAAPPPGENTWWVARLYTRAHGGDVKTVLDPKVVTGPMHGLQIAVPRFSPDGKRIAFIGGLMSDQGSTGGDVFVVNAQPNSTPIDVTPDIDGTPTYISWTGPDTVGFTEDRRGHMLLADTSVSARKVDASIDMGEAQLSGGPIKNAIGVSNHGTLAFIKSGIGVSPEIFAGDWGHFAQITHLADGQPARTVARTESIEWENEGFHVQGWLTYPTGYDAKKKYPMIVTVHGGPTASAFPRGAGQWADLGYFEFQPNPRGSMGQGEKFVQANIKDFGYGDLRDILAGVDAVEKKVPVDDHRLGLTGWSYGGFMSMFASTQTGRFRAIVAGAGISNWQSYYGENSIDQWMIPFFGASVYDDPGIYARSSAITYIKKAAAYKTPMLIIVGDRDGECPAPQSFEMWHALRDLGVKTQLVIYPNEGHGFRDPAHIRDRQERTQRWFAENLK